MKHNKAQNLGAFLVVLLCALSARGQDSPSQAAALLKTHFGFSAANLAALQGGTIVTRLPQADDAREVAALGAMRLNVTKVQFLEQYRDIESFKKTESVIQLRRFSAPPRAEDLADLTLEAEHVAALKKCAVGACDVKMPAALIERFRKEVNWSAANHKERATALTKEFLLDYVRAYLREGNAALVEYGERPYPQRLADEVRSLLDQSTHLLATAPHFYQYLREFPRAPPPAVENILYWSKEKIKGYKAVLSLWHVTIYKQAEAGSPVVIAAKQIYANHYFEASLALTWVFDDEAGGAKPGSYLIYLNRSRMEALRGGLNWLKRYVANRRVRDELARNMRLTKERLEGAAAVR